MTLKPAFRPISANLGVVGAHWGLLVVLRFGARVQRGVLLLMTEILHDPMYTILPEFGPTVLVYSLTVDDRNPA